MKNYKKYADEIKKYKVNKDEYFCDEFIIPHILKKDSCADISCEHCHMLQLLWLMEEYEEPKEPEIDWSKIKVDTPILVRQGKNGQWLERHFAKYENGNVYAWVDGQTSWTGADEIKWKYAKLVEDQKEPEIDWSKIKVDTPILVRDNKDNKWLKRYFAKYEDGLVYAWLGENTSYDACGVAKWKYAKLAESEEE